MPALANMVLTNGSAASVTYSPMSIDSSGVAKFAGLNIDLMDARPVASQKVALPSKNSSVARVSAKNVVPIMDPVVTTTKIGELTATTEFLLPRTSTKAQRTNIRALHASMLAHASMIAAVDDLESQY
jgi:hypothetical protein